VLDDAGGKGVWSLRARQRRLRHRFFVSRRRGIQLAPQVFYDLVDVEWKAHGALVERDLVQCVTERAVGSSALRTEPAITDVVGAKTKESLGGRNWRVQLNMRVAFWKFEIVEKRIVHAMVRPMISTRPLRPDERALPIQVLFSWF